MPDKIRYGNDYRIAIGIEHSYNAGGTEAPVGGAPSATSWTNLVVLPGTLEIVKIITRRIPSSNRNQQFRTHIVST